MKWVFYVIVFVYMFYRTVYGAKVKEINSLSIEPLVYEEENFALPNRHKTIACKYTNTNQKVEWFDPGKKLIKFAPSDRITTQKHTTSLKNGERIYSLLLTFADTQVEDTGTYTCRSGEMTDTVDFCVIAPADFVDTPTEVVAEEGRHFTLSCQARGEPEPQIEWLRNGELIQEDDGMEEGKYGAMTRYNMQGFEGLLNIYAVTPEDAGIYTCIAKQRHNNIDCAYQKSLNISVTVNYKPRFAEDTETVYGKYNKSIDLVCSADGHPVPEYKWYLDHGDNVLSEYSRNKVKLSDDEREARITLVGNSLTFGQAYVCKATNDHGEASKEFILEKMEKPVKPGEIIIVNATDTELDLNVTWPEPVNFPIDRFIVNIMPGEGRKRLTKEWDWRRSHLITLEDEEYNKDEGTILKLADLEPETEYWIRVRAMNELGSSPWSNPVLVSTHETEEETEEETDDETDGSTEGYLEAGDDDHNDEPSDGTMFYGIFFAGGILVLAFACMVLMRLV